MLKVESVMVVACNSGALSAKIIGIPDGTRKKTVGVGDIVAVAIQKASPTSTIKAGQVARCIIVRTKKEIGRTDGTYIRFGDNACVIIDISDKGELKPRGKRIFGPVAREVRDLGWKSVSNIAEEVL